MDDADRLAVAVLARSVCELIATVGQLNALIGSETGENTGRHIAIKENLFDLMASVTRIADRFAPPAPPEEV